MDNTATIYDILWDVQQRLCVPKGRKTGGDRYSFPYRNASDILTAVKPLLPKGCVITLSDEIVMYGDRLYVLATATIQTSPINRISVTACSREPLSKPGNDPAQITGACSTYARKYALCGLLMIDDSSHDPDSQPKQKSIAELPPIFDPKAPATAEQIIELKKYRVDPDKVRKFFHPLDDTPMSAAEADSVLAKKRRKKQ